MKKKEKRQYDKVYYKKNREKINKQSKVWQRRNVDKVKASQKRYIEKFIKEHGCWPSTIWAKKNRERARQTKLRYKDKHRRDTRYWVSEKISYWRKKYPQKLSNLTTDYLVELFNKQKGRCYYTGVKMVWGSRQKKALPNTPSLDRLSPKNGYIKGNVVWCSFFCNTMKGGLTEREFYKFIGNIFKWREKQSDKKY